MVTVATPTETDTVRDRVLTAAAEEFAQYGVAGARIDRIARRAKTSKERLYAYFRGKQQLYRFVADRELAAMAEATRMDATDLPGYAGRVHDYFTAHPDHLRLLQWSWLDIPGTAASGDPFLESVRHTLAHSVEQLRQAQLDGLLDAAWDPIDVMVVVTQIALSWVWQPDLVELAAGQIRDPSRAARRAAIVAAVAAVFPAAAHEDRGGRSCGSG